MRTYRHSPTMASDPATSESPCHSPKARNLLGLRVAQKAVLLTLYILCSTNYSHNAFITAGEWGLLPDYRHMTWRVGSTSKANSSRLVTELWGHKLASPVGVAAGLDKNARVIDPLFALGTKPSIRAFKGRFCAALRPFLSRSFLTLWHLSCNRIRIR